MKARLEAGELEDKLVELSVEPIQRSEGPGALANSVKPGKFPTKNESGLAIDWPHH